MDLLSPPQEAGTSVQQTTSSDVPSRNAAIPNANSYHHLRPYSTHPHPSSVHALAVSPTFSLQYPQTAFFLTSPSYLPIRLLSAFTSQILATYPLVKATTEAWIAPHSLLFTSPYASVEQVGRDLNTAGPTHFLAGSDSLISCFDLSRHGEGPVSSLPTAQGGGRKTRRGGGAPGMRGIISALAVSNDGVLAAGTFSRWVGLYDGCGLGETVGTFQLGATDTSKTNSAGGEAIDEGRGVTELKWSTCGRYLLVAERGSGGMGVWDIRFSGQRLAWLRRREAKTMQRLGVEIVAGQEPAGDEVWAGGTDGSVRVWRSLGMREGVVEPDWGFKAHDGKLELRLILNNFPASDSH